MRAEVIPVSDVTDSTQPELETTGGDLVDDGGEPDHSTPTTETIEQQVPQTCEELENCASDQVKAEAHLDSNGQSIEDVLWDYFADTDGSLPPALGLVTLERILSVGRGSADQRWASSP